ncbi:MAG: hypothetical protein ABIP93_06015 [Gemmatimonadaceae bacterium]
MKGGKEGRKRRSAGGSAGRQGGVRGTPKKGGARRPENAAPPKGSPKKPQFGARTTAEEK